MYVFIYIPTYQKQPDNTLQPKKEIRTSEAKTPDNLFSSFKINDSDADKNSESGLGSFSFGGKLGGFSGENVKGDTFGGEGFGLGTKGSADDKGVGMGMNDNGGFGLGGAGFAEAKVGM
eukprot:367100-Amorphochlora_amoeboformis.AAC.1